MVLSRLRRYFSRKSSSPTAYTRLHTPSPPRVPIIRGDNGPPKLGQHEVFKQPESTESSPPHVPIIGDNYSQPKPAHQLPITMVDEVFKPPEASPPQRTDEVFKQAEASPPRPEKVFKQLEASPPRPDEVFKQQEASPPRPVTNSDGDGGDGSGNENKTSAMYRIENELRAMNEEAATHCSFGPVGADIFRWEGVVIGPAFSCYEGGMFHLSIHFPSDYPFSPPLVKFLTKIFHPNVEKDGTIWIDVLKENWSPALTIEKLMLSICSILSNPEPQVDSIVEASRMYLNHWGNYKEIAREWTKQYAMGNPSPH